MNNEIISRAEYTNQLKMHLQDTKNLQVVYGNAGVGKSYILREFVNELKKNNKDQFVCHIDISDCADEREVYYKIACELENYYHLISPDALRTFKEPNNKLTMFLKVYHWLYGESGKRPSISTNKESKELLDSSENLMNKISDLITSKASDSNYFPNNTSSLVEKVLSAGEFIAGLIEIMPYIKAIKSLYEYVKARQDVKKNRQLLEYIETLDIFKSRKRSEVFFRQCIIESIPQKNNKENIEEGKSVSIPVIILDNFLLDHNNDIGRDHTWLSQPSGIIENLNANWIIASRHNVLNYFNRIFENSVAFEVFGFDYDTASDYLTRVCEQINGHPNVKRKIIEICNRDNGVENNDPHNAYYLPYLLNLAAQHYNKLNSDPQTKKQISPQMFIEFATSSEFIGYYFYKDLSDLMVNAYQILSCLRTWDDDWVALIRERFDNHLLNARTLLFKTAPMEDLGNHEFKLHEGIRDALYLSENNYIKQDVFKFVFDKFISIYSENIPEESQEYWYSSKRLSNFMDILNDYISSMPTEKEKLDAISKLKDPMDKLCKRNIKRGDVQYSFIRFYSRYIDLIKKCYNIPFISLQNVDLKSSSTGDLADLLENITEFSNYNGAVYYMKCIYNLEDMYTNINESPISCKLEYLGVLFWDKMQDLASNTDFIKYSCIHNKLIQLNAYSYDCSQEGDYPTAINKAKEGLDIAKDLTLEIIKKIQIKEDNSFSADDLKKIVERHMLIEESNDGDINNDTYHSLKNAYRNLLKWNLIKKDNINISSANDNELIDSYKKLLAELLLNVYLKLRGNYPWYCIRNNQEADNDERILYGLYTYWIRNALYHAALESKDKNLNQYASNMLKSYNNYCVYLYKGGQIEKACIISNEVMAESNRLLPPNGPLRETKQLRIDQIANNISNGTKGILEYLWEERYGNTAYEDDMQKKDLIIEEMQYMGDYYLHLRYYRLAFNYLSFTFLYRYVHYGFIDNKTLDSILRLFISFFALRNTEFCDLMLKEFDEQINKQDNKANSITNKIKAFDSLTVIYQENKNNINDDIIITMLRKLDN